MANEFANWSDKKLKAEYSSLHNVIYVADCFGTHDLLYLEAMGDELAKRGYKQVETVDFIKEEDTDEDIEDGELQDN